MTAPDTVIFNTLEQLVSSDANLVGGLAGKAVGDLVFELSRDPDNLAASARPIDAVRRGLGANVGAGLTVDISAGSIHQFNNATAFNADQSPIEVGRLDADTNVAVGPADGALPRVTLISCQITQTNTGGVSRNILTLPSRTVTPTVVNKRSNPTLTLVATVGTPAANPPIPATPAGNIPLWAVYIPAGAAFITSTDLADMRVFFTDWNSAASNGRIEGAWPTVDTTITNIVMRGGRAMIFGVQAAVRARTFVATSLLPGGTGALVADTEYQVYAITAGNGTPVGAAILDNTAYVLTSGNAPLASGQPSVALTYRPLFDTNAGADSWQITTDRALYLGSLYTDGSGNLSVNGNGFPQNHVGDHRFKLASNGGLTAANAASWMKRSTLTWLNNSEVVIGDGCCVIDGMAMVFSAITVNTGTDIVAGDALTPDTWYYVYIRRSMPAITRADVSTVVGRISSEAPSSLNTKTTPEAGFALTDYVYVGSFLVNATSQIQQFQRNGLQTTFINHAPFLSPMPNGGQGQTSGSFAINTTATALETWLPATSSTAIFSMRAIRAAAGSIGAFVMSGVGNTNAVANASYVVVPDQAAGGSGHISGPIACDANNQFEVFEAAASDLSVQWAQLGYIEDLY